MRRRAFESSEELDLPRKRQCARSPPSTPDDKPPLVNEGSQPRVSSFVEKLGSELITIYVGPAKRPFYVHKRLFCGATKRYGIHPTGYNGQPNMLVFGEDADAFELLIEWIYKKSIDFSATTLLKVVKLYCLAEKYNRVNIMDYTVDHLFSAFQSKRRPPEESFGYAYQNSLEDSPLRNLMSSWFYATLLDTSLEDESYFNMPTTTKLAREIPELAVDLFLLIRQHGENSLGIGRELRRVMEACDYHQHTAYGDPCPYHPY